MKKTTEQSKTIKPVAITRIYKLGHTFSVTSVFADERFIYTVSKDSTVKVWDKSTFREIATLQGHIDWLWSVFADDRFIYTASGDNRVGVLLFLREGEFTTLGI